MSSLADRVTERLQEVGMTPAQLARAAKVKPPSISGWISGKTKTIKGENLLRAAQALKCSAHWLATGIGSKTWDPDPNRRELVAGEETVTYLTDSTIEEALQLLRQLDRVGRSEALQWLRGFAAGRKNGPPSSDGHGDPVAGAAAR